jgi:hypothetical protein
MKKKWQNSDIEILIHLYKKNIPIKIIGQIFGVTSNAIGKSLQRYSPHHTHNLQGKVEDPTDGLEPLFRWMKSQYLLFYDVIFNNYSLAEKTIYVNKILVRNRWFILNSTQTEVLLFRLKLQFNYMVSDSAKASSSEGPSLAGATGPRFAP